MENIKFAHQSFSENGIRFYLSTDGTIYVSTKIHKIEKELKKHAKLCSVLKQHQIQLYELILEKDFNEAYKLCMDIKHESGN
ncbi:hypothetical protein [Photorhabdus bodei]|uniref:hypothetical protein n=1 Tax=Photorhabdus bodei TaxID=2029681 RepID=UPI001E482435|nr:hypothetical protein [Photorhabdus bodei]MCC8463865.1 hypothetical protein [Photorhabdus bodei]